MTVYNPIWLQIIFYIAIAGFPCLSLYMFYLAYEAYAQSGLAGAAGFLFLGVGIAYISYIGLLLTKFVSAKLEYDELHFILILMVHRLYTNGQILHL